MHSRLHLEAVAIVVVAMGLCLALTPTVNADLIDSLALYSDMEDGTAIAAKTLPDEYGNPDVDGTIGGSNILQVTDAGRGNVIRFNTRSTSNFVNYGDNFDPGTTSYTVAFWVKRYETSSDTFYEYVASKGNGGSNFEAWSIFFNKADNTLRVRANHNGLNDTTKLLTYWDSGIAAGEWHHVAMVIDQTRGLFQAYFDGVGSGTDGDNNLWNCNEASYSVAFPPDGTADFNTSTELNLGRMKNSSNQWVYPFRGDIDDFAIWTRALSTAEIQTLYNETDDGSRIMDVPEPGALALVLGGLAALAGMVRRRG